MVNHGRIPESREVYEDGNAEFDRRDSRLARWEAFTMGIVVGIVLFAVIQAVA